ncbi:hypothetical protein EVAR_82352_1 [Eumeta japonica]|uniref:Uncharacterized protein n=1 Tax=Eumeta variegata TaxID=151549 RepID=A0A4C1UA51_EUMVA|nr:hypothetical protein EVAR_82352_1 [Eumeta japonica]
MRSCETVRGPVHRAVCGAPSGSAVKSATSNSFFHTAFTSITSAGDSEYAKLVYVKSAHRLRDDGSITTRGTVSREKTPNGVYKETHINNF